MEKEEKNKKKKKEKAYNEVMEDTTKYGEFVSSYFGWVAPRKQKHRAKELEDMTEGNNKPNKENN